MNRSEQIDTVREFAKSLATQGMCVDWVIFVIVSIFKLFGKAVKGIAEGISDYFREAEPHQIMGNLIIVLAIVVPLLLFGKCNGE